MYNHKKIVMIYLEPTPYIVGLIGQIQLQWDGTVEVLFVYPSLTQSWDISFENIQVDFLPASWLKAMVVIWGRTKANHCLFTANSLPMKQVSHWSLSNESAKAS